MTGTAAHVAHFAKVTDFNRETVEQFAVKRLALKLMEKMPGILLRKSIIVFADQLGRGVHHIIHNSGAGNVSHILPSGYTRATATSEVPGLAFGALSVTGWQ